LIDAFSDDEQGHFCPKRMLAVPIEKMNLSFSFQTAAQTLPLWHKD
jgi:hypothetical protein